MVLSWAGFTQWLTNITHNPVFISLTSIFTLLGAVLVVLSKTSLGKKALKSMQQFSKAADDKVRELQHKAIEMKNEVESFKKELEEKEEAFKQDLLKKTTIIYNQMDMFENYMTKILCEFPNAKVQSKLKDFASEWGKEKDKIAVVMGESYSEVDKKYNELQKQIDALKEGMNDGRKDNRTEEKTL